MLSEQFQTGNHVYKDVGFFGLRWVSFVEWRKAPLTSLMEHPHSQDPTLIPSLNLMVGPAMIAPGTKAHIWSRLQEGVAEISHRSPAFSTLCEKAVGSFRAWYQIPQEYQVFFLGSSTEAWEVLIRSTSEEGGENWHVVHGNFGQKWAQTSEKLGRSARVLQPTAQEERVTIGRLEKETEQNSNLMITSNETSTGVAYSAEELKDLRVSRPDLRIMIDATSGWGGYEYDVSSADAWHLSVQKGLGLPAGLGVLVVHQRLIEMAQESGERGQDIGAHHSLPSLQKSMQKHQTPTTPNALLIDALSYVCQEAGARHTDLKQLEQDTREKALMLTEAIEANPALRMSLRDKQARSITTLVVATDGERGPELKEFLAERGIAVSSGYGGQKSSCIRLGCWMAVEKATIQKVCEALSEWS